MTCAGASATDGQQTTVAGRGRVPLACAREQSSSTAPAAHPGSPTRAAASTSSGTHALYVPDLPGAAKTAWVDGVLVVATVAAWVLGRDWLTWRRDPR